MASLVEYQESVRSPIGDRYGRSDSGSAGLEDFRVRIETDHARSLSKLIEGEIIPRLMVAHAIAAPAEPTADSGYKIDAADVEAFAPLAMQVGADGLLSHVEAIIARGVSFDDLLVDLLAPAARLLGEYWESDRCDFVDVTMGLWRLQEVIHEISARMPQGRFAGADSRRALFATMPGDQHSFGTVVIEDLFRRDGWLTDRLGDPKTPDVLKRVANEWFDLIGLTVSCESNIAPVVSIIAALRNVSKNPRICVMVGGRIFSADPDLAMRVGADGTAPDAKVALQIAGRLVREREWEAAVCN